MVERWKSKKTGDAKLASAMFLGLPSARLARKSFRTGLWHARRCWIPLRRPPTLRLAIVAVIANLTGSGPRQAFCSLTRHPAAIRDHDAQGGSGIPGQPKIQPSWAITHGNLFSLIYMCSRSCDCDSCSLPNHAASSPLLWLETPPQTLRQVSEPTVLTAGTPQQCQQTPEKTPETMEMLARSLRQAAEARSV